MEPITFVPCVNTKCTHNAEGVFEERFGEEGIWFINSQKHFSTHACPKYRKGLIACDYYRLISGCILIKP